MVSIMLYIFTTIKKEIAYMNMFHKLQSPYANTNLVLLLSFLMIGHLWLRKFFVFVEITGHGLTPHAGLLSVHRTWHVVPVLSSTPMVDIS